MSDTPTAAQDLGIAAPTSSTEQAPSTPVLPNISYDDALTAKAQRLGDPQWRDRYMKGGIAERAEMDALMVALSPRTPMPSDPSSVEQAIDHLRERADISEAIADHVRRNLPISPQERKLTESLKTRLFSDKAWVRKYLDGDREAANTLALIQINLSLPVSTGE